MKWQVKQKIKRIAALLLSFVLLFDALEISAPAPLVRAMEESFGAFCAVTAFAELPQELREQTLPLGAQESEIELPGSLSVTANVLEALPKDTAPAQTENAAQSTVPTTPIAEIPEEEEVLDADAEPQIQVQPQTAPAAAQGNVSLTLDGVEEVPYVQNTIRLDGVQWRIDAKRSAEESFLADEEHAGASYTYVAVLPKKDGAGNTVVLQEGAQLPEIHVTVEGEKDAEAEKETERVTGTESETESESESEKLTEAGETEIKEITEKAETETESKTETETEIETEEETDAEKEAGSDLAVENEEEAETETETETEMIIEAEDETESETEEQEVSLMTVNNLMPIAGGDGVALINGNTVDLTPYITDVDFTWTDKNGIQWPITPKADGSYEFPADHTLGFTLNYFMPKGTVTRERNVVTYKLPAGFEYTDITDGKIAWGNGTAGTYTIKGGVVTLTFDPNSEFFATDTDFTGYVTFDSKLKADSTGASGSLEFKEDVKFTYTITEKKEEGTCKDSSFSADKSCTEFEGSKLNYKIVVKPGASGATNVTLKDKLSVSTNTQTLTGFSFDDINVSDGTKTLTRLNDDLSTYTEEESVTTGPDDNGQTVTTVSYKDGDTIVYKKVITKNADGTTASELIVPEDGYYAVERLENGTYVFRLPDMESTEQYTITYSADLADVFADNGIDPNWDTYSVSNSVDDSHDTYKDTDWQNHTSSWIKKSSTGAATLNNEGKYEAGWKIEINPDHQALPLDTEFSDKLDLPAGITWENGALTITVTHKDGSSQKYTELSELLSLFGSGTGMKIEDLLAKLGITDLGGASTTDDTITIEYTTTVPKSALPNGTTTATNTSTLTEGGHNSSSSASTGMENDILTKEADSENVRIENVTYSENGESKTEQMILIPWEASVTMEGNIGAEGDNTEVTASITDTFGEHLWVTPKYLKKNLEITMPDGTPLSSPDDYTLLYTTDRENHNYEEPVSEDSKVIGFKVVFNPSVYDEIKGRKLALKYTLYGDADFMRQNQTEWLGPQRTFVNTIQYGENTVNAEYTKDGDYFVKELLVNYTEYKQDNEIDWDSLQEGRLVWRVIAQLASTSVGKDIVITDIFPAELDLYSVSVERNYGFSGKTEPLIFSNAGSHTLQFSYNDGSGDETANIEITITKLEDGRKEITAKIPGSIVKEGNKSYFDLRVEATVPEDSELLDPKDLNVQEKKFTNRASLQVGGEPSNEDDHTVTVKKDKPVLKKDGFYTASEDGPRVMHYVLKANPDGAKRLNTGKMLTLEDTLTYEPDIVGEGGTVQKEAKVVSLVPGSVKAYFYDEIGQKVYLPAKGKDFSYKYEEIDSSETTEGATAGKRQNKLTMYIPDALAVYIEYDYELQSNQKKIEWQIDNEAVLIGSDQWESKDEQKVEYESSTAGVTKNFVNFYKVDEDNYNITLPDAEFALYQWEGDAGSGKWVEYRDASGNTRFVSDSKGHLPIEGLKAGVLYWLKETDPPLGYQISDQYGQKVKSSEPADDAGYYFYLVDANNAPVIPADFDTERIHELSGANTVYIPNKSTGAIAARKVWADGTTPVNIELTLYQGDGAGYTYQDTLPAAGEEEAKLKPVTDAEGNVLTQKIEAGATGADLTVTWDGLKKGTEENPIYYYVFETKAGADGTPVVLEDGSYMIDGYNVEYSNNFGITAGTVTITNSKPSISVEKVWADKEENDHSGESVNVELYQSFTPPEAEGSDEKEIGLGLGSINVAEKYYWQKSSEKYGDKEYADYGKKDITSDTAKVELGIYPIHQIEDSSKISIVCSDENVHFDLEQKIDGAGDWYLQTFIWTATNITQSCKIYVYVDEEIGDNNILTVTGLESQNSGLQLPEDYKLAENLPEEQSAKVTLNEDNGWWHTWTDLPSVAQDSDGTTKQVYYYVAEEEVEGYSPKYSYKYNEDGTLKLVTVTNRPEEEPTKTSITVEKKWLNSDNKPMTLGEGWQVELQLYQKQKDETWVAYPKEGDTVMLSADEKWRYTWPGLPYGEYCVQEVSKKEGFTVSYQSASTKEPVEDYHEASASKDTITVINKAPTTEIEVEKRWENGTGYSATMQLYQSTTPPAKEPIPTHITVGVDSWWTSEGGAGEASADGKIIVEFYECDKDGNLMVTKPIRSRTLDASNGWSITESLDGITTDINGEETIHYYTVKYIAGTGVERVVDESNDSESEVLNGQTRDHKLNLTARLPEPPKPKHITLYINMESEWPDERYINDKISTDGYITGNEAIIKIRYQSPTAPSDEYIRLVLPEGVEVEEEQFFTDYPFYLQYRIHISDIADTDIEARFFFQTTGGQPWPYTEEHKIEDPVSATALSLTPRLSSRARNGARNADSTGDDGLILPDGSNDSDPAKLVNRKDGTVTLNSDNEWHKKWDGLPQYDSEGNKLYYYVKELNSSPAPESTKYEYAYFDETKPWEGIKQVTVTNTLPTTLESEKTSVTVKKNWAGYDDSSGETNGYVVQVQLQQSQRTVENGVEVASETWSDYLDPVKLEQGTGWTGSWSNLDRKVYTDTDSYIEYQYQVVEVKVFGPPDSEPAGEPVEINNFTSATKGGIQEDGSYTFTITNTKKRQGITLPGTGSKYPWIFYGIGTTFLLIALAWMSRALKKSYIPSDTGKGGRQSDE